MQEKEQAFQKVMQLYPLWNQDPMIDQFELRKQAGEAAAVFSDLEQLLVEPQPQPEQVDGQQGIPGAAGTGQGVLAPGNATGGRQAQRTTVTPGGGSAPANQAF